MDSPDHSNGANNAPVATKRRRTAIIAVVFAAAAAAAAFVPHMLGYGWFGHRILLYGESQLYVLNISDQPRQVSVDSGPPEQIDAGGARLLPLVGGVSSIQTRSDDESSARDWTVETNRSALLLNLSDATCLIVSELTGLTDEQPLEVEIIDQLDADTEIYDVDSRNVIWPRAYPGVVDEDQTDPVRSVEIIDCHLFDDEQFLEDYLQRRFEDRLH